MDHGTHPRTKKEEFEEIQQEATKHDQIGSSGKSKTGTCAPAPKEASTGPAPGLAKVKGGLKGDSTVSAGAISKDWHL